MKEDTAVNMVLFQVLLLTAAVQRAPRGTQESLLQNTSHVSGLFQLFPLIEIFI